VTEDIPLAPFAHEGLDPVPEPKSTIAEVSDAVKGTVNRVSGAIEAGRKIAALMPLEILHSALVLLGGTRLESAEVAPLAGLQVHLPRIEPVFA
jgi:hypothetical protein